MFKYDFMISNSSDEQKELDHFISKLRVSGLDQEISNFLLEQINTSLCQSKAARGNNFAMNKVLEGEGYKLKIAINKNKKSVLSSFVKALIG